MQGDARLSKRAESILRDRSHEILISAAVGWEIAIKSALGKISPPEIVKELPEVLASNGFVELPIALQHTLEAGLLPLHHRDPFDRMLVAQAEALEIPILSADRLFDRYPVKRIW
jgi:PIN domain nuclease of toxin-antitoxin system